MTQAAADVPPKAECCTLMATPNCRARLGTAEVTAGYLVILDGKVGLVGEDCRAVLLNNAKEPESVGPEFLAPVGREEIPGEEC